MLHRDEHASESFLKVSGKGHLSSPLSYRVCNRPAEPGLAVNHLAGVSWSASRAAARFGFFPRIICSYPAFALGRIIELGIVPKDAFLIEGQTPLGRNIRGKPGARRHSVVQRDYPQIFALLLFHRAGKCVTQAFDHLEE
jgi:hypothetical protein